MINPDDMELLMVRVDRRRLLEEHLTSLGEIWPSTCRWRWSPDDAMGRHLGDDWIMDFRGDCAEAIAHVKASNSPKFVELACEVVCTITEIIISRPTKPLLPLPPTWAP